MAGAIRQAIKRGDLGPFAPTEQAVLNGVARLWLALNEKHIMAAAVTDIVESEWRKACEIKACGGKDRGQ